MREARELLAAEQARFTALHADLQELRTKQGNALVQLDEKLAHLGDVPAKVQAALNQVQSEALQRYNAQLQELEHVYRDKAESYIKPMAEVNTRFEQTANEVVQATSQLFADLEAIKHDYANQRTRIDTFIVDEREGFEALRQSLSEQLDKDKEIELTQYKKSLEREQAELLAALRKELAQEVAGQAYRQDVEKRLNTMLSHIQFLERDVRATAKRPGLLKSLFGGSGGEHANASPERLTPQGDDILSEAALQFWRDERKTLEAQNEALKETVNMVSEHQQALYNELEKQRKRSSLIVSMLLLVLLSGVGYGIFFVARQANLL